MFYDTDAQGGEAGMDLFETLSFILSPQSFYPVKLLYHQAAKYI